MSRHSTALAGSLLATIALLAVVGCGGSKHHRAEILFSRGPGALQVIEVDSGAVRSVRSTSRLWADAARWSPDGKRIVFAAGQRPPAAHGDGEVYEVDFASGAVRRATDDRLEEYEPVISPDGARLALVRGPNGCGYHGGGSDLVLLGANGDQKQLTHDCLAHDGLSWSPDGKKLLFGASHIVLSEIHVLDIQSGDERRLTQWRGDQPRWSPDGAWIAFTDSRPHGQYLVVMRADGSDEHDLAAVTKNGSFIYGPAWSPDSKTIAWSVLDANGSGHLELIDSNGEDRRALTSGTQTDSAPVWSPDGQWIAFTRHIRSEPPRAARIAIVRRDGQRLRVLPNTTIRDRFAAVEPRWRPPS